MKFQNKYKRDMDKVTVPPAVADVILNSEPKRLRKSAMRVVALAVCLCIVFSSVLTLSLIALFDGGIGNPLLPGTDPSLKDNNNATVPLVGVNSYNDIYSALNKRISKAISYNNSDLESALSLSFRSGEYLEDTINEKPSSGTDSGKAQNPDYSDTNNQVEGVQEGDIIKTDGRFIYTTSVPKYSYYYTDADKLQLDKNFVYIVSAENGEMAPVSKIEIRTSKEKPYQIREIMLFEDTLVIIKQSVLYQKLDKANFPSVENMLYGCLIDYFYSFAESFTAAEIYDITDRANPKFKGELYQSGTYKDSRMIGQHLYLISNYNMRLDANEDDAETFIPVVSSYDKKDLIPASSIYFADDYTIELYGASYHVVSGIDVTKPDKHQSSRTVLCSYVQNIYASDSSIYITARQSKYPYGDKINEYKVGTQLTLTDKTNIYRLGINDGKVTFAASGTVDGTPVNQFAMDEYKGVFRIATTIQSSNYIVRENTRTVYETSILNEPTTKVVEGTTEPGKAASEAEKTTSGDVVQIPKEVTYRYLERAQADESFSNVYTLDLGLKQLGKLTGLGKTERIYSVRYNGDIGYVVTFRQTDPLYAIDLSDAKAPKVLSELKIPGFSNYMHPYGEGLLFGFGMDADSEGRTQGMKLSMFDVSDKADVKEIATEKLTNLAYSSAQYNHKAILVNANKNLIGFPVIDYSGWNKGDKEVCKYYLYSYEDGRFVRKAILKTDFDVDNYNYYNEMRGIYIGDYAYMIIQDVGIISYDMNKFEKVDSIKFDF